MKYPLFPVSEAENCIAAITGIEPDITESGIAKIHSDHFTMDKFHTVHQGFAEINVRQVTFFKTNISQLCISKRNLVKGDIMKDNFGKDYRISLQILDYRIRNGPCVMVSSE